MKRLNPKTGKPFRHGDSNENGKIFKCYELIIKRNGHFRERWYSPEAWKNNTENGLKRQKIYHISTKGRSFYLYNSAKKRSKKFNLEINITANWIDQKLIKGFCELTGLPFDFKSSEKYFINPYSPSIDRINSEKGYTKDNVRIVLSSVNAALGEHGEEQMLPILKAMVIGIENANKKSTTSVPNQHHRSSKVDSKHGIVS